MKILLIHQYFLEKEDGGGSRFNEMVKSWADKGHEITVLCGMVHYNTGKKKIKYKGKFIYIDNEFYENVKVVRCHVSENYNVNFIGRLWAYFSFVFSSIFSGFLKIKTNHDLVLVTSPPLFVCITGYLLSKLNRCPFIFEVRDLWPESAIDTGVLRNKLLIKFSFLFEKFILKKASLINVLTPSFKDKLINEKGVKKSKILYIPNGADFSIVDKLNQKISFDHNFFKSAIGFKDKFVITYVGAHGRANNLIQLINAAEKLDNKNNNIIFQLIGSGMEKEYLINEVKNRNIKNVIFRNPVSKEEIFKFILSSDVGVSVLKKTDTFKTIYSNKTFDYLSCKTPVLMIIDGISRKLIQQSDSGIYAEPENIDDIVSKINYLYSIPRTRLKEMGNNGYEFMRKKFDRNKLSIKYLESLKKIIVNI